MTPREYSLSIIRFHLPKFRDLFSSGGYGDGSLDDSMVSVEHVRVYALGFPQNVTEVSFASFVSPVFHQRNSQTFPQEAVMWKRFAHPSVMPLVGITIALPRLI